ncbi:Glutathione transferase GST 23 [Zea mays]|uniref:Glutathione transferase GST 23 n=1 Tax=Zea mays TaxID=4577 RepID=A0A3L6EYZ5_MAIZE|nr:Glutathione transferase GST 23 [Zea mays]
MTMKGVEYEYVEEDLRSKSAQLLVYNPVQKKVPVLVYKGRPVVESQVILEFIDDAWSHRGDPILPRDPYQHAMARFWASSRRRSGGGSPRRVRSTSAFPARLSTT